MCHLKVLMSSWQQIVWDRPPESDVHRDRPRDPYEQRDAQSARAICHGRKECITDFVSQFAIGDQLATSAELLLRSRQLIADSKAQILRIRMHLATSDCGN